MLAKSLIAVCLILAATVAFAAPVAPVAPPSIADAQNALTGASTAWADVLAAWTAIQPTIMFITSVIASASALSAAIPHPAVGSALTGPRKLLDWAALAIGHAAPGPHINVTSDPGKLASSTTAGV